MVVAVSILTVKSSTKTFVLRFPLKVFFVKQCYVMRMLVKRRIFRLRKTPAGNPSGLAAFQKRKRTFWWPTAWPVLYFSDCKRRFCLFTSAFLLVRSVENIYQFLLTGLINGKSYTRVLKASLENGMLWAGNWVRKKLRLIKGSP